MIERLSIGLPTDVGGTGQKFPHGIPIPVARRQWWVGAERNDQVGKSAAGAQQVHRAIGEIAIPGIENRDRMPPGLPHDREYLPQIVDPVTGGPQLVNEARIAYRRRWIATNPALGTFRSKQPLVLPVPQGGCAYPQRRGQVTDGQGVARQRRIHRLVGDVFGRPASESEPFPIGVQPGMRMIDGCESLRVLPRDNKTHDPACSNRIDGADQLPVRARGVHMRASEAAVTTCCPFRGGQHAGGDQVPNLLNRVPRPSRDIDGAHGPLWTFLHGYQVTARKVSTST